MIRRAEILLEQKRYAEAESLLRQSPTDTENPARALSLLSLALAGQNRYPEALEVANQAIATDPSNVAGLFARSRSMRGLGKLCEAEEAIREALRLAPEDPVVWLELLSVLVVRGRWKEVLDTAEERLKQDPESTQVRTLRMIALAQCSVDDGPLREANTILKHEPEHVVALAQVGLAALNAGRYADAERWFKESLRIQPTPIAKSGLLETLKASHPLFRLTRVFPRITGFFAKQKDGLTMALGILLIPVVFTALPLGVYVARLGDAFANLILLRDRTARVLLSRNRIQASVLAVVAFVLGIVLILGFAEWPSARIFGVAVLVVPLFAMAAADVRFAHRRRIFRYTIIAAFASVAGLVAAEAAELRIVSVVALGLVIISAYVAAWTAT
jgi:tetratricopeptide (TPR) repeat protein